MHAAQSGSAERAKKSNTQRHRWFVVHDLGPHVCICPTTCPAARSGRRPRVRSGAAGISRCFRPCLPASCPSSMDPSHRIRSGERACPRHEHCICRNPRFQSLRDVTLFLNSPLPDASAALSIFFALPPFSDFRFIGSVNNASPSASVRLRLQPGDGQPTALQIAVLMEAAATSEQRSAQLQVCGSTDSRVYV